MKHKFSTFECLFIKLPLHKRKDILIGSVYRPPGHPINDFITDFDGILSHLSKLKNQVFLAGDFNINLLRYSEHSSTEDFLNTMFSHKFIPTILRPTRITETSATLIDNIFTNLINEKQDSCILINDISDHLPIILIVDIDPSSPVIPPPSTKRKFSLAAKTTFLNSLDHTDWTFIDNLATTDGPDTAYSAFINTYKCLYDTAFPLSLTYNMGRNNIKQPWMTKALLKSCKKNQDYIKIYLTNPN